LISSVNGSIYETELSATDEFFKREEKYVKQVFSMDAPIHAIHYEVFPTDTSMAVVFFATNDRFYQFVGNLVESDSGGVFSDLFRQYNESSSMSDC
jgi:hypothetical protein